MKAYARHSDALDNAQSAVAITRHTLRQHGETYKVPFLRMGRGKNKYFVLTLSALSIVKMFQALSPEDVASCIEFLNKENAKEVTE